MGTTLQASRRCHWMITSGDALASQPSPFGGDASPVVYKGLRSATQRSMCAGPALSAFCDHQCDMSRVTVAATLWKTPKGLKLTAHARADLIGGINACAQWAKREPWTSWMAKLPQSVDRGAIAKAVWLSFQTDCRLYWRGMRKLEN